MIQRMKSEPTTVRSRGAEWVVVQFLLMLSLLFVGPFSRGHWNSAPGMAAGTALVLLGAWLGLVGKRDLGRQRTPFPRPKDDARLVTTGLYARMRHPLYAAVIALGLGWALLWQSWPAFIIALLQMPFFDAKARNEEHWLRERFPDYESYRRRVKRFVPGVY